jgi:hypothetical protein
VRVLLRAARGLCVCCGTALGGAALKWAARETAIAEREDAAVARVLRRRAHVDAEARVRSAELEHEAGARAQQLGRTFKRAERQLKDTIAKQEAVVQERFGQLQPGRPAARQLQVEWHKLPQPVELRVARLRGVKSKLPSGRYGACRRYARVSLQPLRLATICRRRCSSCACRTTLPAMPGCLASPLVASPWPAAPPGLQCCWPRCTTGWEAARCGGRGWA